MKDKDILIMVSGVMGESLLKKLKEAKLNPFIAVMKEGILRKHESEKLLLYSNYFQIFEIEGTSYGEVRGSLPDCPVIICVGWKKDFFHGEIFKDKTIYYVHPSLLPKYRGYGAVSEQFLRGVVVSGLSVYKYNGIIDGGNIVYQNKITIEDYDKPIDFLNKCGQEVFSFIKKLYNDEELIEKVQDNVKSFYLPRMRKSSRLIDFNSSSIFVYNFMRAYMEPYSYAVFFYKGEEYKVVSASMESWAGKEGQVGEVVKKTSDGIVIACGEGSILIKEVIYQGKKVHTSVLQIYEEDIID